MNRLSNRMPHPFGLFLAVWLCAIALAMAFFPIRSAVATTTQVSDEPTCSDRYSGPFFETRVVVADNEAVCHDLTIFNTKLAVNGQVHGKLVSFGGDTVISGVVVGNITAYGGSVTLENGSRVEGDILLYDSTFNRSSASTQELKGSVIDHTNQPFGDDNTFSFPFWTLLLWGTLGMALSTLLPDHVMLVRTTAFGKTKRSLLLGLLSLLLIPSICFVLVALVLTIPLAIMLAVVLMAAWTLGVVAVGWHCGEFLVNKILPTPHSRQFSVVVGVLVLTLAGAIPYIGWIITLGVGLLGLGAVFLSRFGTRLYAHPKQPLTL